VTYTICSRHRGTLCLRGRASAETHGDDKQSNGLATLIGEMIIRKNGIDIQPRAIACRYRLISSNVMVGGRTPLFVGRKRECRAGQKHLGL
jgi:hypothetical protein